jgi:hypothetical protein
MTSNSFVFVLSKYFFVGHIFVGQLYSQNYSYNIFSIVRKKNLKGIIMLELSILFSFLLTFLWLLFLLNCIYDYLLINSFSVLPNLKKLNNTIALVKGKSFYQKLEMFIIF